MPRLAMDAQMAKSVEELFLQDALIQAVARVEEHRHGDAAVFGDIDAADFPNLDVVGNRAYRSPLGF